jgi:hypothetical protein
MRAPVGLDASLSPRVLVMIGEELAGSQRAQSRHWLLDMTPRTPDLSDAALPEGVTYVDPAPEGPRFTLRSINAERAIVEVDLTRSRAAEAGTCEDGTIFLSPGPESCQQAAPPPDAAVSDGMARPAGTDGATETAPDGGRPPLPPDFAVPDGGATVAPGAGPYAGPVCHYGGDGRLGWLPLAVSAAALWLGRRRRSQ